MDPRPKVVLSVFALKIFDNASGILSSSAMVDVQFWRNGQHLVSSGPTLRRDENGCVMVNVQLIILAIDIIVLHVFNDGGLKLGSVYIDLKDMLKNALGGNFSCTHDAILDSEDFAAMQLVFEASPFPPLPPRIMLNLLVFEFCSEEMTDADFMKNLHNLYGLLQANIFLILVPEQFCKLRDRCSALASTANRLLAFIWCADLLDDVFHATSNRGMYVSSRLLYEDFATTLGDLDRPMQSFFASVLPSLPDTTIIMQAFSNFLIRRHLTTGNQIDLTQGILLLEAVSQLRAGPHSHDPIPDHFLMHLHMGNAYSLRYKLSHDVTDLDMSLTSLKKALELQVPWWTSGKERRVALYTLAWGLHKRFKHLGAEHDLERAAEYIDEALTGLPADSSEYLEYLSMYATILRARFDMFRRSADLDQAVKIEEEIMRTSEDLNLPRVLVAKHNLALLLVQRYSFGNYQISESVATSRKYIEQTNNSNEADLRRAIELARELVSNCDCTNNNQDHFRALLGLALLFDCLAHKEKASNLDEAISILSSIPPDNTKASSRGVTLSLVLYLKYVLYNPQAQLKDMHSVLSTLSHTATSYNRAPKARFLAAQIWAKCAEVLEDKDRASVSMDAHKTAMSIIPSIVGIDMAMQDRLQSILKDSDALQLVLDSVGQAPSGAASFAIECGEIHTAIEWLEQGHSIIWDQLLQFRVPLDDLQEKNPELAQKLNSLAKDLSRSSTMPHFWTNHLVEGGQERKKVALEAEGQKHRRLVSEWQKAVSDARKLPAFEKFLLPKDFDYLSRAANDSGIIVIINVSPRACDALIILPAPSDSSMKKDVLHVPLPTFTCFDAEGMHADLLCLIWNDVGIRSDLARKPVFKDFLAGRNASFRTILGDLWYKVVLPILCKVMEARPSLVKCDEGANRAHLYWCPTGHLAFLPLHAAGDYSMPGKGHRVFDFVVSSYIPTLNSIIRPTSPAASQDTAMDSSIKVLAVACPYAKGQVPIPDTEEEVTRVGKHVVPLLDQPTTPVSRYTALVKKAATAERVLEEMQEATWVHLACHGTQDATTPTNSALLLSDGTRILLSDIAAIHLPHAEFAFLSACQTATGYDKIPSESMHLAAGMLLAGYRSVIGTMWSIEDRHAPQVADDVYAYLLRDGTSRRPDYRESGLALHFAMEKLRERIGEDEFLAWVPYIHIGA